MKRTLVTLFVLGSGVFALTGEEIIDRVDDNRVVNTMEYEATMVISMGDQVREKSFRGYAKADDHAYIEFTAPARDKGTRFLKLSDEMWMYVPIVEKAIKIAGHMLRQSLMGSDFSYDDFTENERMEDLYAIELTGTDTIADDECYVLEMTARVDEVTYYRRKMWVVKTTFIPVKTELYAKSGKLMKEFIILETEKIGSYHYPIKMRMINKLRADTFTELMFSTIKLDVVIPSKVFTKAYLERK